MSLLHPGAPAKPDLIEWLVGDECRALDDGEMIEGLGARLRATGLPLDRLTLHLRTLHPQNHRPHARLGAERAGRNS